VAPVHQPDEVMEFVEPNEGKAIRMFQSVNDRGVPLARMDIVKSLLVYYSNRYLDAKLDDHIAHQFGMAFRSFNRIKRLARDAACRVTLLRATPFGKTTYSATTTWRSPTRVAQAWMPAETMQRPPDTVLETFLKPR